MGIRLFIYGTLKRGQVKHHLLAGQRFLGPAVTVARFRLLDLGWYPGLAETAENGVSVEGEVWEISHTCLEQLDAYEGSAYVRQKIELERAPEAAQGGPVEAYVLKEPDWTRPDAGSVWLRG